MAAFVVDLAGPGGEQEAFDGLLSGTPAGETVFVDAPSLIEAVEKVLSARPGADILGVSKGRPGTVILR